MTDSIRDQSKYGSNEDAGIDEMLDRAPLSDLEQRLRRRLHALEMVASDNGDTISEILDILDSMQDRIQALESRQDPNSYLTSAHK